MFVLSIVSLGILYLGYRYYGSFLEKIYNVKETEITPSVQKNDGYDYVPTNKWILLGHHFSSIAGAGPIVGPIIAAVYFGWVPALIWIIVGSIFLGSVHDFSSLIISVRHEGKSIAEIANIYINKKTYKVFLIFIWFALMYVVAVFTDITASTFASQPEVSEISVLYILIAVVFGYFSYKLNWNKAVMTVISIVIITAGIVLSFKYRFMIVDKQNWINLLLIYAFLASVLPVWILLQPRDYLSSYLLYFSVVIGLLGLFFLNSSISYPAYIGFYSESIGPLFPFLFVTIACGAISGFHSLVASGTTSKQIDYIKNAKFIGVGSMILEGVVGLIALSTVMILIQDPSVYKLQPGEIYSIGISKFSSLVGIGESSGKILGFLIISGFVLTTLDTATRIARYIFQEIIEKQINDWKTRITATLVSLLIPLILLNIKTHDQSGNLIPCWKLIWPIFGITNQLLAALVLVIIYLWSKKENIAKRFIILIPALFMIITTIYALTIKIFDFIKSSNYNFVFFITSLLLLLALFIVYETSKSILKKMEA